MSYFDDNEDYIIYGMTRGWRRYAGTQTQNPPRPPKSRVASLDEFENLDEFEDLDK